MKGFAWGIFAGCVGLFSTLAAFYVALAVFWPASFPAPTITRLSAMDEKLRFLREHPEFDPTLIAVGSSITWRQIAGVPFEQIAGGPGRFLNGATVKLQIHQTRDLLEFYLLHYKRIRGVLMMVSLPDFSNCTTEPARMFDHWSAKAYAFDRWPAAFFYLRYFSPQRFAKSTLTLAVRQQPMTGDLFIDDYGSGPLHVPEEDQRGLRYQAIGTDPACVEDLVELSRDLWERGIRLTVVFPPLHPDYRLAYPAAMPQICQIAREVAKRTQGHNTRLLLMLADRSYAAADFFDAFHLQYPAVERLSAQIANEMMRPTRMENVGSHSRPTKNEWFRGANRDCNAA